MTIIDLLEQRRARQRAAREEWLASQDRQLAAIWRMIDALTPLVDQMLAEEKLQPRGPRCEVPRCSNDRTTLHPVPGCTPAHPAVLVPLCSNHLAAVVYGRLRVAAIEDDALWWRFWPVGARPRYVRSRRRRNSRAGRVGRPC